MAWARDTLEKLGRTPEDQIAPAAVIEGALALAVWAEPGLDPSPYIRHITRISEDVEAYVHGEPATARLSAEAARQVVNRRYGYIGAPDPEERGDGANIARVIDKRRGGALALAMLYVQAVSALDIHAQVIDFPGRALVRLLGVDGQRLVLDPFEGGRVADARRLRALHQAHRGKGMGGMGVDGSGGGEHAGRWGDALNPFDLAALGPHAQLVALQDDIKIHHLRLAAPEAALAALEAALLVAPNSPRLWREAGLLHARLEHIGQAISALEHFLDLPGGDAHRYTASQMLQQLRQRQIQDPK